MLDMLKNIQNSIFPLFNVVPILEQLCQAVVTKNEQENLQPTLNEGAGDAILTIFVTDCLQTLKKHEKVFLKLQKEFLKVWKLGAFWRIYL